MPNSINLNDASATYEVKGLALNLLDSIGYFKTKAGVLNLVDGTGYGKVLSRKAEWEWENNIWKGRVTLLLE
jgi:hypothetical protein